MINLNTKLDDSDYTIKPLNSQETIKKKEKLEDDIPFPVGSTVYVVTNYTLFYCQNCNFFRKGTDENKRDYCANKSVQERSKVFPFYPQFLTPLPCGHTNYTILKIENTSLQWIYDNRFAYGITIFTSLTEAEKELRHIIELQEGVKNMENDK